MDLPRPAGLAPLLLVSLLLAGCGPSGPSAETIEGMPKPPAFVFARGGDAQKLDPADIDDGESVNVLAQICEGLVRFRGGTLDIEPALATEWEISPDGKTYTFTLREGVTFHDGTPLTARTAAFSFQRQLDPAHPAHFAQASFAYWTNLFGDVESVTAPDERTLVINLERPNASLLRSLATFPAFLVSPGALGRFGAEQFQRNPVGTGPYRFVEWKPGEAIILERNERYWGEPAAFERLVFKYVANSATRVLELKGGEVHAAYGFQPGEAEALEDEPLVEVHQEPGMNVGYLAINGLRDYLDHREIRKALAMAIDREKIVQVALNGAGTVAQYPVPPVFPGYPEDDAPPIEHDPEEARRLLARHPALTARTLTLRTFGTPRDYFPDPGKVASVVRADLEAAGLTVEIVNTDFKTHLDTMRRGDYELGLLGWIGDNGDPDNFLATLFGSWAATEGSATNVTFYKSDLMDRFLEEARRESNEIKRAGLYRLALRTFAEDMPLVPLVHGDQIAVTRAEVTGFELQPNGTLRLGLVGWEREITVLTGGE